MVINSNSIAGISYTLTSNLSGEILEKTPSDKIMKFKFGVGELLPIFEENLTGLQQGDNFDFVVPSDDAYGPMDPYGIFDIPKDTFVVDGKIDEEMIQVGNQIPMTDNQGHKHLGVVTHVMENALTMNFNHPLAGVDLRFVGEVIEVFE
jgi:FKBP-type peptidyl-prolyl cis-trans isomerase SlyD